MRPGRRTASGSYSSRMPAATSCSTFSSVPGDGGAAVNLTQTPDIREGSPRWSPDGKTIALDYKPKEGSAYDLALLDFATRKVSKLTHEESPNHSWNSVAWSRDGKTLFANRTESGVADGDVYAVDVASGKADEPDSSSAAKCSIRLLRCRPMARPCSSRPTSRADTRTWRCSMLPPGSGLGDEYTVGGSTPAIFRPAGKSIHLYAQCRRSNRGLSGYDLTSKHAREIALGPV